MTTLEELWHFFLAGYLLSSLEFLLALLWEPLYQIAQITTRITMCTYTVLFARKSSNRWLWRGTASGSVLNLLAIFANGFQMPVFTKDRRGFEGIHKKGNRKTRLKFLTDVYPGGFGTVFSIGDVLIIVSLGMLVGKAISETVLKIIRAEEIVERRLYR